jgi:uridine kinase
MKNLYTLRRFVRKSPSIGSNDSFFREFLILGLFVRALLIINVEPSLQKELYSPFLSSVAFSTDPWQKWISEGGNPSAFPYGLAMLIIHMPSLFIGNFISSFGFDIHLTITTLNTLMILTFEVALYTFLHIRNTSTTIQLFYWLNPIFLYINYIQGANDLLPGIILLISGIYVVKQRPKIGGVFLGIAIGMKLSIALAIPICLVFLLGNPRSRSKMLKYFISAFSVTLINYFPLVYSDGFRRMILENPEISNLLSIKFSLGEFQVLLFPFAYMWLLYWIWKAGRTSVGTLIIFLGVTFASLILFNPGATGWMLWGTPIILVFLSGSRKTLLISMGMFQGAYTLHYIYVEFGNSFNEAYFGTSSNLAALFYTLSFGSGLIFLVSSLRDSLLTEDVYGFGRRPLVVSIAGDSGVGKDLISSIIRRSFGESHATELCGDNYHHFERSNTIWQEVTHLNPNANNLALWRRDLVSARERLTFNREIYSHNTGEFIFSKSYPKSDLIISQGLHALYPEFDGLSDLKIFVSMEDTLRRELKIKRDSVERGKSKEDVIESLNRRRRDSKLHLIRQVDNADLRLNVSRIRKNSDHMSIGVWAKNLSFVPRLKLLLEGNPSLVMQQNSKMHDHVQLYLNSDEFKLSEVLRMLEIEMHSFDQMFEYELEISDGFESCIAFLIFLSLDRNIMER